jgi:uncharacterized membrane protein YgcG
MSIARLKILGLLLIAVASFLIHDARLLVALFVLLTGAWFALRLPAVLLLRLIKKLAFFIIMILLAFALFPSENIQGDVGRQIAIPGTPIMISLTGLLLGGLMALRMLIVIIASQLVQLTAKPGEFVAGLRGLMIPEVVALTIDSTLYLLGPQGGKTGRGMGGGSSAGGGSGGGGGRGRHREERATDAAGGKEPGFFSAFSIKRIKSGDFGFLIDMIEQGLARSRTYVGSQHEHSTSGVKPTVLHDVSIISGLSLLMLTAKLLKVLPGIPFAPGYKITFLVPLYILAAELTHTRFGATITGTTVGVISFLFGDGRFGIFEILKHITPGIVVDLAAPLTKHWMRKPSIITFVILGSLCAFTRSTTMLAVVFFVEGNALLYAMVGFQAASQIFFGALSGFVTFYLVKSLGRLKTAAGMATGEEAAPTGPAIVTASVPVTDPSSDGGRGSGSGRGGGDGSGGGRGGGSGQKIKQPVTNTK